MLTVDGSEKTQLVPQKQRKNTCMTIILLLTIITIGAAAGGALYHGMINGGYVIDTAYGQASVPLVRNETVKLTASDGANYDYFGHSVSVYDNTAVIGAFLDDDKGFNSGSAYVFEKNSTSGNWTQTKLLATNAADDWFGHSVSVYNNTAVIGAFYDDDNGRESGSAYVFEKNSTSGNWTQKKLLASDGAAYDNFGWSVSVYNNTAVIGAFLDDDNGPDSGSAYVFEKNSTSSNWTQKKLTASDGAADDWFGHSVSVYNNTAVIGAFYDDDNGSNSGSAYVYEKVNGVWTETKLTASDAAKNDRFGYSVSVYDNTAVIGAFYDDDNGSNSGSAYVYEKVNGVWTETKLTASDAAKNDRFGYSVSVYDNTAVIGAFYDDDNGSNSGSAYVFEKNSTSGNWTQTETVKLTASDGAVDDYFGRSVSVYNNTAVIGAFYDDDKGTNSGSAYVFSVDTTSPTLQNVTISSSNTNSTLAADGDTVTLSFTASESIADVTATIGNAAATVSGSDTSWTAALTLNKTTHSSLNGISPSFTIDFADLAGNNGAQVTEITGGPAVTVDFTAPTLVIATTATGPTSLEPIPFTVDFGENMTSGEFAAAEITLSSGTVTDFTPDSANRLFAFNAADADDGEDLTVDVAANVATDLAGNNNTAADQLSVTVDRTAPTPVITTTAANYTNLELIPFTVNFGENMTSGEFAAAEITLSSGTVTDFTPDSANRLFIFNAADADDGEDLTVDVAANVATDLAGNNNTAADQLSVTVDRTAPAEDTTPPSIISASVTNAINIIITFDDTIDVTTTDGSGFTLSGQGATVTANTDPGGTGNSLILTVSGITTADVPNVIYTATDGTVVDDAGNVAKDQTFDGTTDDAAPTLKSAITLNTTAINLVLSEDVTDNNVAPSDFTLSVNANNKLNATSVSVSSSTIMLGLDYTLDDGDIINVEYRQSSGTIDDVSTQKNPLETFGPEPVRNNLNATAPINEPPDGVTITITNVDSTLVTFTATRVDNASALAMGKYNATPENATLYVSEDTPAEIVDAFDIVPTNPSCPCLMTLAYDDDGTPMDGINLGDLTVFHFVNGKWNALHNPDPKSTELIYVTIDSFSPFAIIKQAQQSDLPVVDAGKYQSVNEGAFVTLEGSATDPDGDILTYLWSQDENDRLQVTLSGSTGTSSTFIAPQVDSNEDLTFLFTVYGGTTPVTKTVTITVLDTDDALLTFPGSPPGSSGSGSGSGGGGGGGSSSTWVDDIYLKSVSWDCNAGTIKIIAGPDSDYLSVSVRTTQLGVHQASIAGDDIPGYRAFVSNMDKTEDYIGIKAVALHGRDSITISESINITECTGERTFDEYMQPESTLPSAVTQTEEEGQETIFDSPLYQQLKGNIPAEMVQCNEGLVLVLKPNMEESACVRESTAHKLVMRGWHGMS